MLFDQPLTNPVLRSASVKRVVEVSKEYQYLQDTQEHKRFFYIFFAVFLLTPSLTRHASLSLPD